VHHREDETFLILDGDLAFVAAGREHIARAGDYVFLPREVPHHFAVASPTAHVLNIVSPAGFEHFFIDLGEPARELAMPPAPDGPPDIGRMIRVLSDYGVELLGEPPPPDA
jgi:quercetin dioxygenase-like cupin family protein